MKRNNYSNIGGREFGKPLPSRVAYVNELRAKGYRVIDLEKVIENYKTKPLSDIWIDEAGEYSDVQEIDPNHTVTYNEKYYERSNKSKDN